MLKLVVGEFSPFILSWVPLEQDQIPTLRNSKSTYMDFPWEKSNQYRMSNQIPWEERTSLHLGSQWPLLQLPSRRLGTQCYPRFWPSLKVIRFSWRGRILRLRSIYLLPKVWGRPIRMGSWKPEGPCLLGWRGLIGRPEEVLEKMDWTNWSV